MTTQTRHLVFETNSSSTHSISIAASSDGVYDTIPVDDDGVVHLHGGNFGWEWDRYNDAETKANYCAIDAYNKYSETYNGPIVTDEVVEARIQMLKEVIMEVTGAIEVVFDFTVNEWDNNNNAFIDHQSSGTAHEAFENKETLKDFIFNPASVLWTGNDGNAPPIGWYENDTAVDMSASVNGIRELQYAHSRNDIQEKLGCLYCDLININSDRLGKRDKKAYEGVMRDIQALETYVHDLKR
jgi:hypothetical protein